MKKILIVEDEDRMREIYKRLLTYEGFGVFDASGVQAAIEIIIREGIDLVLLDINLPGVDGSCLNKIIRSLDMGLKVITTSVLPLDEQKRLITNASDYYDKSQGIELLLTKVKEAFKNG